MLLTFLYLACRRGEAFRLKWEDVDFHNKQVRLWTRKRAHGTMEFEWVPMVQRLYDALTWWKENCPIQREYVFICLDKKYFCSEYYGGPFSVRQHFMRRLCEKADVKPFGFHAIRHIASTSIYQNGNNASVVQRILRHKSPTTTNRYLRSMGLEGVRAALENHAQGNGERFNGKNEDTTDYIFGGK